MSAPNYVLEAALEAIRESRRLREEIPQSRRGWSRFSTTWSYKAGFNFRTGKRYLLVRRGGLVVHREGI